MTLAFKWSHRYEGDGSLEYDRSFQKGRFGDQSLWAEEVLAGHLPFKVVLMTFHT